MLSRLFRLNRLLLVLSVLCPLASGAAQQSVQLDTVRLDPRHAALVAPPVEPRAFCSPLNGWKRNPATFNVWLDSLVPQPRPVAPDCAPGEATVLVRPSCVFAIEEFLFTRARAQYVALICPPQGFGMPLTRSFPRPQLTDPEQ